MTLLSILLIGGVLGVKHSLEPDHLIAVSNMVTETKKVRHASILGLFWGIGHTATLLVIGMLLVLLKLQIPDTLSVVLEGCVGIMLVYFGIQTWKNKHTHIHAEGHTHNHHSGYNRTLFMGVVHGISGSASLVLLTIMTVDNPWESFLFMFVFGIGTTISMMTSTAVIGLPFAMSGNSERLGDALARLAAFLSILFGLYYTISNIIVL